MKKTIYLLVTLILLLFTLQSGIAQPTYNLTARNFTLNAPAEDQLEFDIYLQNTSTASFEYAAGQYFLSFNNGIASGNADLEYTIIENPLPIGLRPLTPSIGIGIDPVANVLRLASNPIPTCGSGLIIPTGSPGTKIVRMRLRRISGRFNVADFDPEWRNPPISILATTIYYFPPCPADATDLTTPLTHTVSCDPPIINCVLPVELASFTSSIDRNNVTLNWTTASEVNNSGFDIERKILTTNEWTKVNNISGNGTTNESKSYSFSERVNTGKYNYRLRQIDYNGNFNYFDLSNEIAIGIPDKYQISQNYPNPFNPTTRIDYDIPLDGKVSIVVYDLSGRELANLVNEIKTAGYYTLQFNAGNLASGIYFYRITAGNFISSKKMAMVK